jgi:nitrite reductase (NADH) small subunit
MTLTAEPDTERRRPPADAPRGAWIPVCRYSELIPGRGVAALLDAEGTQAAVFRTAADKLYAVGNRDPFTDAHVISRGLTGARDGIATIASPMLKHIFDLCTGACIDGPAGPQPVRLPVHPVRCIDGVVSVYTRAKTPTGEPA